MSLSGGRPVLRPWLPFTWWPSPTGNEKKNARLGLCKRLPRLWHRGNLSKEVKCTTKTREQMVSSSPWPLDKKTNDAFMQGWFQSKVIYSQINVRKWTIHNSVYSFIEKCSIFLLVFVNILLQSETSPVKIGLFNAGFIVLVIILNFLSHQHMIYIWTLCRIL